MNPKEQATQQSQNVFNNISNSIARYYSPAEEGKITLPKVAEQDFYKEPARFFNFLVESTFGSALNLPRNLYVGSSELGAGIGSKIVGRQGADEQLLRGAGMLGQGVLDVLSFTPYGVYGRVGKGVKAIQTAETLAPTAGKIIAKEAGVGALYGAGYGLAGGLQEAAKQPSEERLGSITTSTLTGGLLGGLLGGIVPSVSLAKRKIDEAKFNQVKPKVESSLEKFSKEVASENPKDVTLAPKKNLTQDTSINVPKQQKQNIRKTALQNTGLENIKSTDVNVNNTVDNVLTNLSQNNIDGAKQVLANAPKKVRTKATKFFITLAEKGKNIDNATRNNLLEIIDAGKNPTYVTRQSSELSKIAFKMTQDMDRNDVKNSLSYFSGLLRESKDEFRRIKLENPDSKITLETIVQRNLTNAVADLTNKYGVNVADYLGSLIVRGYDEGFKGLSKSVTEVLSRYGTGSGQSIQSFANLVTPSRVINEVTSILQQTFLKDSPQEVAGVNKTAQDLSEELQTINQDALGDKEVADKISEIGEKIVEGVSKKKKKTKETAELIAKRAENTLLREPKDDLEKKEQEIVKDIVEQAYKIIKEIKEKKILDDMDEVKPITFQDKMEKFREALKNTKKYAKEWEQAKQLLKDKYAGDEYKLSKLENFFDRNIPSVLTDKQKLKITTQLLKQSKYRLNEIIRESGYTQYLNRESLRETLVSTFYGVDEEFLTLFVDEIIEVINKRTENARREAIDRLLSVNTNTNPKQKKDAAQKLFELANIGVFDDAEIANKIFQVKGVPHLSEKMVENIKMQLYLAQLPEGMERKISIEDAYRNIAKDIVENNKFSLKNSTDFITAYNSYFYTNIFSSFQTQERNILGGLINALVFKPAILIGEAIAGRFTKGGNEKFSDVGTYYKASLGNIGNAVDRFKAVWDKDYIAKTEDMSLDYFYREYRRKQLPKPLQVVGQFMEASDQFIAALIENGVSTVLQKRGFTPEQAQEQAFLASQQLLGKSYFKSTDIREVGIFDAFFNYIGKFGTELKGKNNAWNLVTTPIVPVLRLAINFQKLKLKLFPPAQLINMMTKKSRNVEDYAYLSVGTAVTAFAIDKYLNNEVTFEAPKDEATRRLFYDSGRKPFSVKIGDNWVPFQYLELFSAPLIFMGAVNSAFRENPDALTEEGYQKAATAIAKFVKGFLVSPTYLANVAEMFAAFEETNGKSWEDVLAYPSTGFVPVIGLIRDIQDIIDPVRRKKESGWDEWKALYARDQLKPYFNYEENPVKLSATELYAPYGIGITNPEYDALYQNNIGTKQFTRRFQADIEEQNKAEEDTKRALFVAINQADYNTARRIIIENKLTPQQVGSVTNKITEREIFKGFTPEQRAIYNLTANDAENLINRKPELQQEVQRIQSLKGTIQTPQESVFQQLKDLNKPIKIKPVTARKGRTRRIKKVRAKIKKGRIKQPKLKKLKPIKLKTLKPVV